MRQASLPMRFLHVVGVLEATSFLALLLVAMPLKYLAGDPAAVKVVGMAHGLLFVGYVLTASHVAAANAWPLRRLAGAFVAAMLPLGTIVFQRRIS